MLLLRALLIITCGVMVPTFSTPAEKLTQEASQRSTFGGAIYSAEFHVVDIDGPVATTAGAQARSRLQHQPSNFEHSSHQVTSSYEPSPENLARAFLNHERTTTQLALSRAPQHELSMAEMWRGLYPRLGLAAATSALAVFILFSSALGNCSAGTCVVKHFSLIERRILWAILIYMKVLIIAFLWFIIARRTPRARHII